MKCLIKASLYFAFLSPLPAYSVMSEYQMLADFLQMTEPSTYRSYEGRTPEGQICHFTIAKSPDYISVDQCFQFFRIPPDTVSDAMLAIRGDKLAAYYFHDGRRHRLEIVQDQRGSLKSLYYGSDYGISLDCIVSGTLH